MSNTLLFDLSERLLEVCVDALDDPPTLQVVTDGDPMTMYGFCPLVAVSMAPNGMFPTINVRARGPSLPARPTMKTSQSQLILKAWVITDVCWPTQTEDGAVPPAAEINAHAETLLTDRYDVWLALRDECRAGTLFSGLLGGNDHAAVEPPTTAFGPQGETAGSVFSVYADLLPIPPAS